MGGGDMGIGMMGMGRRGRGAFSMPMLPRRGIGMSQPMLPPTYRPGSGFGYQPTPGYDSSNIYEGIADPYQSDQYRYGQTGEGENEFPWLKDDYNPNAPPPSGPGSGQTDPGIGGGPDGGAQDGQPSTPQANSWGDFLDRVMEGMGMFGFGGLARGMINRDMDVRSAEKSINSMNVSSSGALNPELQGRGTAGQGGDYSAANAETAAAAEANNDPNTAANGGVIRRNMGGIGSPLSPRVPSGIGYASGGNDSAVRGAGDGRDDKIPALLSDGEHVIPADVVAAYGRGSSKAGHERLNEMILKKRKQFRTTLGNLPPPKG